MVERTAADAAASGWGHVRVHCGDAAHPPVEEASYDAVLATFVLFFLDDPGAVLRRWARLLRPGGRLGLATFMSDPDDDLFARLLREFVEAPDEPPATALGPTSFELVRDPVWLDRSLTDAGLATIEVHELRHAVVLEDAEQWWRWGMSHGLRGALERVPEGRRQEAIAAAQRLLEGGRRSDGTLGVDVRVRFTVAR
jgi:SAM-dependent methyltransferase